MSGLKSLPEISLLHEFLECDSNLGILRWKQRCRKWFVSDIAQKQWNTKHLNKLAFTAVAANGYLCGNIFGKQFKAHRIIWSMHNNEWPDGYIDHIDHDRSNNSISNLRVVDKIEQNKNLSLRSNNTSGEIGVSYSEKRDRWIAQLTIDGKMTALGSFELFEDAVRCRKLSATKHGYHQNHGNSLSKYGAS